MLDDAVEIKSINFGVLSKKDILEMSVCELYNSKLTGANSLYDQRMGSMKNNQICQTCGLNPKMCPGHYGHINLVESIIHPLYYRHVVSFLKCFCVKCHSLLINVETLSVNNSTHISGENKFKAILAQIAKIEYCYACSTQQPKFLFSISDSIIYASYKNGTKNQQKIVMEVKDISDIFNNISDTDIVSLGLEPDMVHPRNLILTTLPVISPISRPFVITDNMVCDDDLTIQYIEIIKINNHLKEEGLSDGKRQKYIFSLKFRVKCLMDNSHGKSRHTN
jgi:DNA-directed RNA polymerase beta' subunit